MEIDPPGISHFFKRRQNSSSNSAIDGKLVPLMGYSPGSTLTELSDLNSKLPGVSIGSFLLLSLLRLLFGSFWFSAGDGSKMLLYKKRNAQMNSNGWRLLLMLFLTRFHPVLYYAVLCTVVVF
jgi:hypothetical protein